MSHVVVCPRIAVAKLPPGLIPTKYFEAMEHNQQLSSCCRHPENHEVEARKSSEAETAPDIYIFHCGCGRLHTRFCLGGGDQRPFWEIG